MMHAHKLTIDEPVLLGNGSVMEWLRSAASRVAGGNAKVLITGESGSGKKNAEEQERRYQTRGNHIADGIAPCLLFPTH